MAVYPAPGSSGSLVAVKPRYDNWINGQWAPPATGEYFDVPGRGAGFSLEAPEGVRFLTRSRVFDAAEQEWLDSCPAPRGRDLS